VRTAETIAARGDVQFLKRAETGWTAGVTSQGAATHGADFVRNTFGATGKGVKIGVLSDSVDHIARSYERGELSDATVLPGQAGGGGRVHSFGALTNNECMAGGDLRFADLHWTDPLGASTNDYDLYVLNAAGTAVVRSSPAMPSSSPNTTSARSRPARTR
jgi:hypothetical protein